jgi:hypothetical protein
VVRLLQGKDALAEQDFKTCLKLKPELKDLLTERIAIIKRQRGRSR